MDGLLKKILKIPFRPYWWLRSRMPQTAYEPKQYWKNRFSKYGFDLNSNEAKIKVADRKPNLKFENLKKTTAVMGRNTGKNHHGYQTTQTKK